MAPLPTRTLVYVAVFLILLWLRRQQIFSKSVHRISEIDLSLQLPRAGYDLSSPSHDHKGFYSSKAVKEFCRHHGWEPFTPESPTGRRKVYDLFMVNSELDWMEIRLDTMYPYVDYFIVVESDTTFQATSKPLTIKDNWQRFAKYHDKLIYHQLEIPDDFAPPRTWDYEDHQRNAMYLQVFPRLTGAQQPAPGDAIIVADVDEIPRPQALLALRACAFQRRLTLRSRFYYYSFQFRHAGADWAHPQATYYDGAGTLLPVHLRNGDGGVRALRAAEAADLAGAAWHCSNCFATVAELRAKMASFSHMLLNAPRFRNATHIADSVRNGSDLWGRPGEDFVRVEGNVDVPPLLLEQPERFRYLLDRDGPSAGFSDYP